MVSVPGILAAGIKCQKFLNRGRSDSGDLVLAGNNRLESQALMLADALVGHEEKDFVFLDRAADVPAEFVVLEGGLGSARSG